MAVKSSLSIALFTKLKKKNDNSSLRRNNRYIFSHRWRHSKLYCILNLFSICGATYGKVLKTPKKVSLKNGNKWSRKDRKTFSNIQ